MVPQSEAMYLLQQIDLEVVASRKRLKEISTRLAEDDTLRQAQEVVDDAETALKPLRTRSRDLDLEMQTNTQKIAASEQRLYSGRVKSPKELQDLQSEIASLKERNDQLETDALEVLMAIEAAETALQEATDQLDAVTQALRGEHSDLIDEQVRLTARLEKLAADREKAVTNVSPENRRLYDTMKARKANRPVALLEGRTCGVCGVEQTSNTIQAARKRDEYELVYCDNCGRILTSR